MRRLIVAVLLCACSSPEPPSAVPAVAGDPSSPQPGGGDATGCGLFAQPVSFTLPPIVGLPTGAFAGPSGTVTCANGMPFTYELRDMTGDRQPDLLVTAACDDASIGPLAWRVYVNEGTRFSVDPIRFVLPLPRPPSCATVALVDMDGDFRPDLVTTQSCEDATLGTSRWLFSRNTGMGFEQAVPFALPDAPVTRMWGAPKAEASCAEGRPGYAIFDIDGDLDVDLVVTEACEDARVGTVFWRVHKGTGAGFDNTRTTYLLPETPAPLSRGYRSAEGAVASCATSPSSRSYRVLDLDGDFAPDMLVTEHCADATVGATRWLAYRNDGVRFAADPTPIALPVLGVANAFRSASSEPTCDTTRLPGYSLLDVTGDLRRDLLVTRSCNDAASGVTRWQLHRHVVTEPPTIGFEASPRFFTLPGVLGGRSDAPLGLSVEASCQGLPRPSFFATHLVGLKLQVVVTRACNDPSVGTTRWLLHEASCP